MCAPSWVIRCVCSPTYRVWKNDYLSTVHIGQPRQQLSSYMIVKNIALHVQVLVTSRRQNQTRQHPLQCSGTPLNDENDHLKIRPLWFTAKSMYTCIIVLRIKTTLRGQDGGLISEVPLYICLYRSDNSLAMPTRDCEAHIPVIVVCSVPTHRTSS